jgi:hypothetical protein
LELSKGSRIKKVIMGSGRMLLDKTELPLRFLRITLRNSKVSEPIRIAILLGTLVLLVGLFVWFIYFVWFIFLPRTEKIMRSQEESAELQRKPNKAIVKARILKQSGPECAEADTQFQKALKLLLDGGKIRGILKSTAQLGTGFKPELWLFTSGKRSTEPLHGVARRNQWRLCSMGSG